MRLKTRPAAGIEDIRAHFDEVAATYTEAHGDAVRLLRYRVALIREALRLQPTDRLLEIGCGPAQHLIALRAHCALGAGLDLSAGMILRAEEHARGAGAAIELLVDDARQMRLVPEASFDAAFAVGALEHVPEKDRVFEQAFRILAPGGRLAVLTVNGEYIWYRRIARVLKLDTRHLSTDDFASAATLRALLERAGFKSIRCESWRFVPRGDTPAAVWPVLELLDRLGSLFGISSWRGGLLLRAEKPDVRDQPAA